MVRSIVLNGCTRACFPQAINFTSFLDNINTNLKPVATNPSYVVEPLLYSDITLKTISFDYCYLDEFRSIITNPGILCAVEWGQISFSDLMIM